MEKRISYCKVHNIWNIKILLSIISIFILNTKGKVEAKHHYNFHILRNKPGFPKNIFSFLKMVAFLRKFGLKWLSLELVRCDAVVYHFFLYPKSHEGIVFYKIYSFFC